MSYAVSHVFSGTHWDDIHRYLLSTKDLKLVKRTDVLCLGMQFTLTMELSRGPLNGRELFLCRQLKMSMWPPRTPPRKYSRFSHLFASSSLPQRLCYCRRPNTSPSNSDPTQLQGRGMLKIGQASAEARYTSYPLILRVSMSITAAT